MTNPDFLAKLQAEARLQAKLHEQRVLPHQVDWMTSLIGNYPWQVLVVLSAFAAFLIRLSQYV